MKKISTILLVILSAVGLFTGASAYDKPIIDVLYSPSFTDLEDTSFSFAGVGCKIWRSLIEMSKFPTIDGQINFGYNYYPIYEFNSHYDVINIGGGFRITGSNFFPIQYLSLGTSYHRIINVGDHSGISQSAPAINLGCGFYIPRLCGCGECILCIGAWIQDWPW